MPSPTRQDLEDAAVAFFDSLKAEADSPRHFDVEHFDDDKALNVEESRHRIRLLDEQLMQKNFDGAVRLHAASLAIRCGTTFADLGDHERILALQLAARAEREQMEYLVHGILAPAKRYVAYDDLFAGGSGQFIKAAPSSDDAGISLQQATDQFLSSKQKKGLSISTRDEAGRVLGWMIERFGHSRGVASVTKAELRDFRNAISRLALLRGKQLPFQQRQTAAASKRIKSVTAARYWRSVQQLFRWLFEEGHVEMDPAASLRIELNKHEVKNTPAPFEKAELEEFFRTPLYAGYLSTKRLMNAGTCRVREGHWWAAVLLTFSGMRAGELAQLLPADFDFDGDIPHLKIRNEDGSGDVTKSTKNAASVRDVPLHPALLELGLREWVERKIKYHPKDRVFREFHPGVGGRKSDGMTKFWGAYLKKFKLWKTGRSTHVWRHTFAACLRSNGVTNEDIGAILGHQGTTVTAGYGGAVPLNRKLATLHKLDYGFDIVSAVGGPYDSKRHRC